MYTKLNPYGTIIMESLKMTEPGILCSLKGQLQLFSLRKARCDNVEALGTLMGPFVSWK